MTDLQYEKLYVRLVMQETSFSSYKEDGVFVVKYEGNVVKLSDGLYEKNGVQYDSFDSLMKVL